VYKLALLTSREKLNMLVMQERYMKQRLFS